jgi:putative PIN family toxin of toxin-antitoxin system
MKPVKIVFDTNIWVSYFIKARFVELVNFVFDNELVIYSSQKLTNELTEVLSRNKFNKYLTYPVSKYIAFYKSLVKNIKPAIVYTQSPDPKDNFLFEIAIAAKATHIVTGDKVLLLVRSFEGIEIISLTKLKQLLTNT